MLRWGRNNIWNYIIWTISKGLIPKQFSHTCISPILDKTALFANSLTMIWHFANLIDWKNMEEKPQEYWKKIELNLLHTAPLYEIVIFLWVFYNTNSVSVVSFILLLTIDICKLVHWWFWASILHFTAVLNSLSRHPQGMLHIFCILLWECSKHEQKNKAHLFCITDLCMIF